MFSFSRDFLCFDYFFSEVFSELSQNFNQRYLNAKYIYP